MKANDSTDTATSPSERRAHPRVPDNEAVAVTVLSAPEAPSLEHKTFYCTTNDISLGGINFYVHSGVPVGALLELKIEFKQPPDVFHHIGRVAWTHPQQDDVVLSFRLGVKITRTLDERSEGWHRLIETKLDGLTSA